VKPVEVKHFFDPSTSTLTYVVFDSHTHDAVIIDPVLDYEPGETGPDTNVRAEQVSERSFDEVAAFIDQLKLNVHYILETHAHADHLSASQTAKKRYPTALLGISERIREVQATFAKDFEVDDIDGSQFDRLFVAGEEVEAGSLKFKVIPLPGHTPACVGYLFTPQEGDAKMLFTGDAIFMPDYGTGRCDFPGGSAETLYASIAEMIYGLPDDTQIYVGHDYQPNGRALKYQTTVGEERRHNIHLTENTTKDEFVRFRHERDKALKEPRLILPSLKVNLVAGRIRR
jgi:glyoxylase-like metal-dependent hydrolase (beta-lactamase superfamily II)